jgi:AcrR family transcriptional regulator
MLADADCSGGRILFAGTQPMDRRALIHQPHRSRDPVSTLPAVGRQSHDRIVQVAAMRFRENGVEGVGVADLMKDAGLTHGGFYRHFASRDELVAEAIERALSEGPRAVAAVAQAQDRPLDAR